MRPGVVRRGSRSRDRLGELLVENSPAGGGRDPLGAVGEALAALGFPEVAVDSDFDVARACAISAMLSADGYLRLAEEALRADPRAGRDRLLQADGIRDLRSRLFELRINLEPRSGS